ncbi:hypothetical protein PV10_04697 [Exophiala mesophila]|uniref:Major facilitator superfamily (MFS) profile domain-containing protein n=1 Tax=Exophiala mesophila TaxID=212818 RepID=A0A0D1XZ42_EXOME|nr:uncharacterized protein PV10_04697 [Exophiala mesophila]KIV93486.1 hypothetical protein PV10_04697 [Exophiala mesophila]
MATDIKMNIDSKVDHEEHFGDETQSKEEQEYPSILQEFSKEDEKKILRRIDWRLLPITGAIYCVSLVDRTNLGNAAIAGMTRDLQLNLGMRYSIVSLLFFPTAIIFEIPVTIFIRFIGPRVFFTVICMTWALTMIGFGFVNHWHQLAGVRLVLGALEAGFLPGCLYFLSTWYKRHELHQRYAIWFLTASCCGSFGNILAYGLMQMDGRHGLAGWRWIFIMEGVLTGVVAIAGGILLVGFPKVGKRAWGFLNDREIEWVIARINADRADAEETKPFHFPSFMAHGLELKIWGFAMIFFMLSVVGFSFAFFLPLILRGGMGFSMAASQCLITPPYIAAAILMYTEGRLGDRYKVRAPILITNAILALIGLPIMAFGPNSGAKYTGVFFVVMGTLANIPTAMVYQANNIRGHWKRVFCSITFVGLGSAGGIAGSLVFRSQDAPHYRPGIYACIACEAFVILITMAMTIKFRRDNAKQAAGTKIIENDKNFRYTI